MKTTAIIQKSLAAIAVAGLLFTAACKKEKDNEPEDTDSEAQVAAEDNSQAEFFSNDVINMTDQAAAGTASFRGGDGDEIYEALSGCATVTRDSVTHTVTIDFGNAFCLCKDKRYRKGIIQVTYTAGKHYFDSLATKTITFNNYYVSKRKTLTPNDSTLWHKVEGTHSVTNNGRNSAGHMNWTITASNMKVTRFDGKSISWNSTRNREWVSGYNTTGPGGWTDDVFNITGSASGSNSNGKSYTATITSALVRQLACNWFVGGKLNIAVTGKAARLIDYGNGTSCDADATITINGKTYPITLP